MSIRGWAPGKEVNGPRGMWSSLSERRKGSPTRASLMQNFRIEPGIGSTRPGTSFAAFAADKVTGLHNWITPSGANLVLYKDGDEIKYLPQSATNPYADVVSIFTGTNVVGTRAPSFADLDVWTYFAGYNTAGQGTFQARVFDGANVDKAFRGPLFLATAAAVDGGVGQCTAGTHFVGFVYQNRTGFQGIPTTLLLGTIPVSVTLAAGLRKINVSVDIPAQTDGGTNPTGVSAKLLLIATRADNPNKWYFIPTDPLTGSIGEQDVPLNSAVTLNFVMNFSDEDIAASLDSAQNNFLLLTQDASGVGPFNPSFVVTYGTRMCYCTGVDLYVSNKNKPQEITADLNVVRNSNQRVIQAAFQLQNSTDLFLTGDHWTARVSDNDDVPATWPQPIEVSGAIGAAFPNLVCKATGQNHAWIVAEGGPYLFNGTFSLLPITFLCQNLWNRVNWKAAYAIETADNVTEQRFYIAVPMDGATEPTHLFCIDYTNGLTHDTVDISLDNLSRGSFSSIGVVQDFNTHRSVLWIGPSSQEWIVKFDSATHTDSTHIGSFEVRGIWESGLVRGSADFTAKLIRVGAGDVWARGSGALIITIYGTDRTKSVTPTLLSIQGVPAVLVPDPGIQYMINTDLSKIENYTWRFETNAVGAWMELSGFTSYAKNDLWNR